MPPVQLSTTPRRTLPKHVHNWRPSSTYDKVILVGEEYALRHGDNHVSIPALFHTSGHSVIYNPDWTPDYVSQQYFASTGVVNANWHTERGDTVTEPCDLQCEAVVDYTHTVLANGISHERTAMIAFFYIIASRPINKEYNPHHLSQSVMVKVIFPMYATVFNGVFIDFPTLVSNGMLAASPNASSIPSGTIQVLSSPQTRICLRRRYHQLVVALYHFYPDDTDNLVTMAFTDARARGLIH